MAKISVVLNTLNEEKNLPRVLSSIKDFAWEIVVCDMYSNDKTVEIAKNFGAKICQHPRTNFVEPARNFAIGKAKGEYVLVLDADEEVSGDLKEKLKEIAESQKADYALIPRKNIIFGKWIRYTNWWPDYQIRFFKKGNVVWSDKIHSVPKAEGKEVRIPSEEKYAIVHYNYHSLDQYLERMMRYSRIQAEELLKEGYQFDWRDLVRKPTSEFLSRFFLGGGYKDGVHGLILSFLQAFSEFMVYLRVWENGGFKEENISEVFKEIEKSLGEVKFWLIKEIKNPFLRFFYKFR